MKQSIFYSILVPVLGVMFSLSLSARIFTSSSGKTIDADLHSMDGDLVRFKNFADGKVYGISIEKLSVKDQSFVRHEQEVGRLTITGYKGLNIPEVVSVEKSQLHFNASKRIDLILEKYWASNEVPPAEIVDDATFLRRAYLKIIGRIPTYAEAIHFFNESSPSKRSHLVDKLLDSNGYVSHNFNLWADVLRVKTTGREGSRYGGVYYADWLKDQIRQNVPYDEFVSSLLTAEGYPWDNPATGYYLRDSGMPLDNMAMTAQVFLGTQMQCAQCHNHPFDKWTQKEFYELSAFTYGIQTRVNINDKDSETWPIYKELRELAREQNGGKQIRYRDSPVLRAASEFFEPLKWGVQHTNKKLKLPGDYQYEDAKPQSVVNPNVIFGELGEGADLHDATARVDSYADWLVSENNDRFTTVVANRLWKHAMGKGLIEPVDDMNDDSVAQSPELMELLESIMRGVDYDLKQYLRVLYNTEYFQRAAVIDNPDLDDDYLLQGPVFQRMSSEQIWDSIATLMTPDIDTILQQSYVGRNRGSNYDSRQKPAAAVYLNEKSSEELISYLKKVTEAYTRYNELKTDAAAVRNDPQRKNTAEGRQILANVRDANREWREMLNPDLSDDYEDDPVGMSTMMSNVEMLNQSYTGKGKNGKRAQVKWMQSIRRASELHSPQANGHLLEVFGQSDRMLIENADDGGNVLQALFLMNSWQINGLMAMQSAPVVEARLANTIEEKIETLYVGFLSRKPTPQETEALVAYYKKDPNKARQRIIWAMMNTQQFLFIQ